MIYVSKHPEIIRARELLARALARCPSKPPALCNPEELQRWHDYDAAFATHKAACKAVREAAKAAER